MLDKFPKVPSIPTSFNNVVRSPYTYLLITVVSLLWYFVYSNSNNASINNENCKEEKKELREQLRQEQNKNDALVNAILVKNGIITNLTTITDSLSNKKDDKPK